MILESEMTATNTIEKTYQSACLQELQALKPGNVHIFADGHDMEVMHFIKSAEVSSPGLCQPKAAVGERILQATKATQAAVGMNTNLGIILLCAPLIHALQTIPEGSTITPVLLQSQLSQTLTGLTKADGKAAAEAIVLASPAGLGDAAKMDVHQSPTESLLTMMQFAQQDDRIAWQYANGYEDIFNQALDCYAASLEEWENRAWATSCLYLHFLSIFPDTHLIRKFGLTVANQVMDEAKEMKVIWSSSGHPKNMKKKMLEWDKSLKGRNLNPGTSADLTVCTLLCWAFCKSL